MDGFEPKRASISEVICPPSLNLMERVHSCRSDVDSKRLRLGRGLALEDTKGSRGGWGFYLSDKKSLVRVSLAGKDAENSKSEISKGGMISEREWI